MDHLTPIIQTENLTRDFKSVRAVDALSLSIYPGELFGFVGPDGAGKTTTLRLFAGLLNVTDGSGTVAGYDLASEAEQIKPHIGYMAQVFSLYGELSVMENFTFFSDLYDIDPVEKKQRIERLLQFAGLTEFTKRRAAHLSGGMKKKLALACTLIHQPKVLLLDEPTTGVDPVSRREFWDILTELHMDGTTIVVSTPYMDEADRCNRVGLIYDGKLVICDSPKTIRKNVNAEMIELFPDESKRAEILLSDVPGVLEIQTYGESLHILVDSARKRLPVIRSRLRRAKLGYRSIRPASIQMEEAFISLIRHLEE